MSIDLETKRGGRARPGMLSLRDAAEQLGVTYPSLQKVCREAKGAGQDFEAAVARLRFKGSVDKLRESAKRWAAENPEVATVQPVAAFDTEEIGRVFAIGRQLGRSDTEIFAVASGIAAWKGSATDEQIAKLFVAPKKRAGLTVVTDDDLGGGIGDAKTPRRRR